MIKLKKIQIGYDQVLINIPDLQLKRGELYALIGSNGGGKTTFFKTLCGEIKPIQGEVEINESKLHDLSRTEKSKQFAFVSTNFKGIDFLNVYEYIALGRIPHTNYFGRISLEDQQKIQQTLDLLNISHLSQKTTTNLSDGERQLCSIARALVQDTPVLILDEPTSFLDYPNRYQILQILKETAIQLNKCILLSSHDIELCIASEIDLLVLVKTDKTLMKIEKKEIKKSDILNLAFNFQS
jgi:iron complex transport system ATP-binding protein